MNEDTSYQNLWDTTKAAPQGKFIAIQKKNSNQQLTYIPYAFIKGKKWIQKVVINNEN